MRVKKNCSRCGKNFMGFPQENVCPTCRLESALYKKNNAAEIAKQREVMDYIRDNQMKRDGQSVSTYEVMDKLGVSKEFLGSMIRKDFFGSASRSGEKYPHPCAKCGTTIQSGVYCSTCLAILRDTAKKIGEEREFRKQILLEEEAQRKRNNVILIVEENIAAAEKIKRILRGKFDSYTVITATDMSHTINFLHGLQVKVVLLDDSITLRYNGFKILQKIRDDYVVADTPVIVTTNEFNEQKQMAAINLDAKYYIVKTTDEPADIVDCVNKVLYGDIKVTNALAKVLLIDDDSDDATIEKNILEENFHCTVFVAESGVEGLSVLQSIGDVSLIFISLQMSFMDGFRVLEFIRQNIFFKGVPVIFMDSSDDPEIIKLIGNSTAVGYVNKPKISSKFFNFMSKYIKRKKNF